MPGNGVTSPFGKSSLPVECDTAPSRVRFSKRDTFSHWFVGLPPGGRSGHFTMEWLNFWKTKFRMQFQ